MGKTLQRPFITFTFATKKEYYQNRLFIWIWNSILLSLHSVYLMFFVIPSALN